MIFIQRVEWEILFEVVYRKWIEIISIMTSKIDREFFCYFLFDVYVQMYKHAQNNENKRLE